MNRSALLIVDRNFHTTHVGVRRVIQFYSKRFENAGFRVQYGTLINGRLVGLETGIDTTKLFTPSKARENHKAFWVKGQSRERLKFTSAETNSKPLKWSRIELNPRDFDVSLVTNPWILSKISEKGRNYKFTHAIVLDMVPNLLALGDLVFERWVDAFQFAVEHRKGYEYMSENVSCVLAISDSTKKDFIRLTNFPEAKVHTLVPFELQNSPPYEAEPQEKESLRVLMVNALDHRKNFSIAAEAISLAAREVPIDLTIVGRERVDGSELESFLEKIEANCKTATWYREADDRHLMQLFSKSDLLFFPSKYEGLGLPILEAQALGVPVLSDQVSSCGEFNLNKTLAVSKGDASSFEHALVGYFQDKLHVIKGGQLGLRQEELLASYEAFDELFDHG